MARLSKQIREAIAEAYRAGLAVQSIEDRSRHVILIARNSEGAEVRQTISRGAKLSDWRNANHMQAAFRRAAQC